MAIETPAVTDTAEPIRAEIGSWLTRHGATFEWVPDLDLDLIDQDASLRNQSRVTQQPLLENFVTTYAAAMHHGDEFPPIVVYPRGGKYIVIDGNHRFAAAKRNRETRFPAFVVTNPQPVLVTILTYETNTKHGIPTTPEERVVQGVYLVETQNVPISEAARILSIPAHSIQKARQLAVTNRRLESLRVKRIEKLTDGVKAKLFSVRSDPILKELAELIIASGMRNDDASNLISRLNQLRSEESQLDLIRSERGRRQVEIEATVGGIVPVPRSIKRLSMVVGNVLSLPEVTDENLNSLGDDYRYQLQARVDEATTKLKLMGRALR